MEDELKDLKYTLADTIIEAEMLKANPICHLCQREGYYRKAKHAFKIKADDTTMALCEEHYSRYSDYLKL